MPRIFLPTVTAQNNALLGSDTQAPSVDFDIQNSDHDDSGTEDESTSPDLLHPACHKRALRQQAQQQQEVTGRSAAATALVDAGNKRARVLAEADEDRRSQSRVRDMNADETRSARRQSNSTRSEDNPGQAEQPLAYDTFAVVFMTVALGITIAAPPSSDADSSLVVCDKHASAAEEICIGDRLVAIGGTSAAGLSVDRVQRLIVRGSRPLEITFRRRRVSPDGAAAAATTKRPLGGLERPSRDCLLDTISNIATQEDCLLPDSQPQWPGHQQGTRGGKTTGVAGSSGRGDPSPARDDTRYDTERSSPSLSPPSPPLLSSLPPGRSSTAGGDDVNGHTDRQVLPHRPGEAPPSPQASPAVFSPSCPTEADLLSPSTAGGETHAATAAAAIAAEAPSISPRPKSSRAVTATPVALRVEAPEIAGARDAPGNETRMVASAQPVPFVQAPALAPDGSGGVAGTGKEPEPKLRKSQKKKKKKSGGSASTTAASAAFPPRQVTGKGLNTTTTAAANKEHSKAGGGIIGGGGRGSGLQATAQASFSPTGASALVPTAAEVARILAKLGARGMSELTLYKNLSFDELVRVCRYTGGVDLSKRLPKATMAERLNSLCEKKGALAAELRAAAAGAEARAEKKGNAAGGARSVREAGHPNGIALSTPVRPSEAPTPPPRRGALLGISTGAPSVRFAASPPPLRRPSYAQGCPQDPRSSSLVPTPTLSVATPQQQQQQQQQQLQQLQLTLSPRSSSTRSRNFQAAALPTSPTTVRDENGRGGPAGGEDDQHCWEDWDFLDSGARGRGRGGAPCRKKIDDGDGDDGDDGYGDEEAAWWSQEPDHRDWSPCSSPTAADAAAAPCSRSFPASRVPPSTGPSPASPSAGEHSWDGERGEEGEGGSRRRNPLLPPALSSFCPPAGQQQQQQQHGGRHVAQPLWSGRFSGARTGFTALPKWILRSVRTIGTQTPRG